MARTYDPARGFAPQWLFRGVRNRAIDHVRRRARQAARVASPSTGSEAILTSASSMAPSPAEEAEAEEFLELIGRLDPRHAHLVRLAFVDGWSHSAIAGLTGLPLGTVKTRIRLSLRLIRTLMSDADVTPHTTGEIGTTPDHDARLLLLTDDDEFAAVVRRQASGLCRVERRAQLPEVADFAPIAIAVTDVDERPASEIVAQADELGWAEAPVVMQSAGEVTNARRRAPVLVTRRDVASLTAATLVPAALAASHSPAIRRAATRRLMARSRPAVITSDRLGRVTGASNGAGRLFDRTPRQLIGEYVTDLSAMPKSWSEHQWHRLVSRGWWTGQTLLRTDRGPARPARAVAWMIDGGGMVGIVAPLPS
jgi:RNA polymerase sigma factor (sigma-70 family)